jgi:D-alanyl-D-alanine carboxypeptidase (penicillin-binding protein 5/6)
MEDVAKGGFLPRIKTVSNLLLTRLQQGPEGAL